MGDVDADCIVNLSIFVVVLADVFVAILLAVSPADSEFEEELEATRLVIAGFGVGTFIGLGVSVFPPIIIGVWCRLTASLTRGLLFEGV